MNRPLTVNDAYELISKKILVCKMSKMALEKQAEYSACIIKLHNYTNNIVKKKSDLINKLEMIFEQQLTNFTADRQQECMNLYMQINELDKPSVEQSTIISRMEFLDSEMKKLYEQIEQIERTIPLDKMITQYAVNTHQKSKQL